MNGRLFVLNFNNSPELVYVVHDVEPHSGLTTFVTRVGIRKVFWQKNFLLVASDMTAYRTRRRETLLSIATVEELSVVGEQPPAVCELATEKLYRDLFFRLESYKYRWTMKRTNKDTDGIFHYNEEGRLQVYGPDL